MASSRSLPQRLILDSGAVSAGPEATRGPGPSSARLSRGTLSCEYPW